MVRKILHKKLRLGNVKPHENRKWT